LTNDPGVGGTSPAATGWNSITTLTVGAVDSPTEFTATGTTATTNVNSNNVDGEPESDSITINSTSVVAHAGGTFTYTFNFTSTSGGTALAVGDTVTFGTRLTNDPRSGGGTAATGWQNLPSVVVATVNSTTDPTSFTAIGNIPTTDNNAGNGATGKGTYPYFINGATGAGTFNINGATGTGSFPSTTVNTTTSTATTTGSIPSGQNVGHGAIDSGGDLWITSENTGNTIARVTPTGTALFPPITTAEQPEFPAIDASNNAWIAIQKTASQVDVVSPTGGLTVLTPTTQTGTVGTGALMTATFGAAVDGNGNVWFANRAGTYGAVTPGVPGENTIFVLNGGVSTPGNVFQAISPAKNYIPEAQYPATAITFTPILDGSLNLAIDPSGNVWVTNYTGGGIVELVGAAAPVVTPLSVAAGNKQLGQKP
jgi:streptogramin lyase